ncbi:Tetratricopeptide repeat [Kalmanozyma brasiliensis GHG001]|uniref:Tetratricopeptide repeat n=1 Tax=Kalmanozyma brasiliensis (strain GHG001) TaxID=1365824 RepID=UPI0028682CC6|nr:Tetratricopeptide repeat [Kalmanozyma brasiliensis GHG001]KAF6767473.1 Tetratricopeptide repeat [Kalmanozyma brasiliensis GHG001]
MASNIASSSTSSTSTAAATAAGKLRTGLAHKSAGNAAFTAGDIPSALSSYHHAVLYLSGLQNRSILGLMGENSGRHGQPDDLSSDEEEGETPAAQSEKELSMVYSNMAACFLKQEKYERAIQTAEKALKCDSGNAKAKYRKAQAMRLGGDVYAAQRVLREAVEGMKGEKGKEEVVKSFEAELALVDKAISQREGMARNKWKGFLGKNPRVFEVESAAASATTEKEGEGEAADDDDSKDKS